MTPIEFSKCEPMIEWVDVEKLESDLGVQLPDALRAHYLAFNGGMPALDWFLMESHWEPIWVHEFLPMKREGGDGATIQSVYARVAGKAGYPSNYVPFAVDPGGNLFCVDVADGAVHYWLRDTFDETLTDAQNREKADRPLTDSFERFVASLVSEDDAFG